MKPLEKAIMPDAAIRFYKGRAVRTLPIRASSGVHRHPPSIEALERHPLACLRRQVERDLAAEERRARRANPVMAPP